MYGAFLKFKTQLSNCLYYAEHDYVFERYAHSKSR